LSARKHPFGRYRPDGRIEGDTDHGSSVSRQYAGSLFEQVLFVVTEAVFQSLWDRTDVEAVDLGLRHANLE
jgi:6-phospho-3-hexuloisomerase